MAAPMNDTCDRCGKTEDAVGLFARAYRLSRTKKGIARRADSQPSRLGVRYLVPSSLSDGKERCARKLVGTG